jgi:hypothetical protein
MLLRIDQKLHSFVVQRVRLAKIKNAESNCMVGLGVRNSEEEPLSVSTRVYVIL